MFFFKHVGRERKISLFMFNLQEWSNGRQEFCGMITSAYCPPPNGFPPAMALSRIRTNDSDGRLFKKPPNNRFIGIRNVYTQSDRSSNIPLRKKHTSFAVEESGDVSKVLSTQCGDSVSGNTFNLRRADTLDAKELSPSLDGPIGFAWEAPKQFWP